MGLLAMLAKGFFDFMTVAVVADLLSLTSICAVIIAVDAAFGVGFLSDAIARPFDVAFTDFNDSLSGGICQCVVADVPCSSAGLTPAKPGHAGACTVGSAAGGDFKLAADGVGCRDSTKRHTAGKICVSLRLMGQILCYTSDSDPMISQSRAVSGVLSEPPGCFMGDILLEKGTGKMILFYTAVFFAAFFGRLLKK